MTVERPKGYSSGITNLGRVEVFAREQKGPWPTGTTKYRVSLKNPEGKTFSFPYYTGPAITERPTFKDVVEAVISDASFYEEYSSFEEFAKESGFDLEFQEKEALSTYNRCKEISEKLHALFGDDYGTMAEYVAQ